MTRACSDVGIRAFGPIIVPARSLAPQHRTSYVGHADIGPLRGTPVAMRRLTIAGLTGSCKRTIGFLCDAGVLQQLEVEGHTVQYVLYDPLRDLASYYLEWVERAPAPVTQADFELHRRVRTSCQVLADSPYPDKIKEAIYQRLKPIGNLTRHEVNGLVGLSSECWADLSAWLRQRDGQHSRARPREANTGPASLEDFVDCLPERMKGLPKTFLDKRLPYSRKAPDRALRRRIACLTELRDTGALYAMIFAPRERRSENLAVALLAIARVEEIMRTHAPGKAWSASDFRAALIRYGTTKDILPEDVPAVRWLTIRYWRLIVARLHRYRSMYDPKDQTGLRALLPPRFKRPREMLIALGGLHREHTKEGRARRKREAHEAFRCLDDILDAAQTRAECMRALGEANREAKIAIAGDADFHDFEVTLPRLDRRGLPLGGRHTERLRLWRTRAAASSIAAELRPLDTIESRAKVKRLEKSSYDQPFIVEHLYSRSANAFGEECWMLQLARLGVFTCPTRLSSEDQEARYTAIREHGLPGYQPHGASLLGFEDLRAGLSRYGRDLNRSFVPLDEMEAAVRFSALYLRMIDQTFRRGQEIRQTRHDAWVHHGPTPASAPEDEQPRFLTQLVFPKVAKRKDLAQVQKVSVTVRQELVEEAEEMRILNRRIVGTASPIVPCAADIRWKCGPAEYVFSFAGRALLANELNLFLRYVLAGWPPFTAHDFRHAEAEEAEFDGEPESKIQAALGHGSVWTTRDYTELPPWAEKQLADRSDRRRAHRLDERSVKRRSRGRETV